MKSTIFLTALAAALLLSAPASTEILSADDGYYQLRHEATSSLAPEDMWRRLVRPETWWHPDHTYSGSADNLSLEAYAGGLWREDWDGNSVTHGRVILVQPGKMLRMDAPFGPLQGLGAYTIWTITISPDEAGSKVVFDETAIAPPPADLDEVAKAVDFVKGEAIRRLTTVDQAR